MIGPIVNEKWYSLSQLVELGREGYLPFSSRYKFVNLIEEGKLSFVNEEAKKFLGEDVVDYFKKERRKKNRALKNESTK